MTPRFLGAVVDTLLPGDHAPSPLPSGTSAGVAAKLTHRLAAGRGRDPCGAVLEAVARRSGGQEAFARADIAQRTAVLKGIEQEMGEAFGSLVSIALQDYYEAEPVLLAMGWRVEPPQPEGHVLPPFDEALLEPVKRRARMWRTPRP